MDDEPQLELLLDALAEPLAGLLSVDDDNGSLCELPQLVVRFWLIRGGAGSPSKIAAKVRPALHAVARLMFYSQQVSSSSAKKARLWRRVLGDSRLFGGSAAAEAKNINDWVLQSAAFPHVVLDFSRMKVRFELMDAICSFFEASGDAVMDGDVVTEAWTSKIGLKFVKCRLGSQDLILIQQLLDRICDNQYRAPQRFKICSLDLSVNGMNTMELLVVAAILKNNDAYQLEEVVLENVIGRNLAMDGLNSLRALIEAAFDVDTIVKPTSALHRLPHCRLEGLSLQGNSLGAQVYASIFSASRHSRAVKDLSLAGTLSLVDASEREQCWRWLAFGLFYPLPSGLRERFKVYKIDLSGNPLYPNDVEALRRTLENPTAELLARGEAEFCQLSIGEAEESKIGVCSVQKGAKIYADPDISSARTFQLDHQTEMEALCSRANRVCVLIPGFGFGWVQAECVTHVDQQALEDTQEDRPRYELILNGLSTSESTSEALQSLFETIGHRLCALELRHFRVDPSLLESIVVHCTQLERLDLESCSLVGPGMAALLSALRGELGSRLLSLNLNANYIGFDFVEQLAVILASPDQIPALQDLRLGKNPIGERGLIALFSVLRLNKTLSTLELDELSNFADFGINVYQGELLWIDSLPMDRKVAFLSVLVGPSTMKTLRSELDTWTLTLIFQFAAQDVRRRIVWRV